MKKLYILLTITGFVFASCSAKEESPNPVSKNTQQNTTTGGGGTGGGGTGGTGGGGTGGGGTTQPNLTLASVEQFWGKIDGNVVHIVRGQGDFTSFMANSFSINTSGPSSVVFGGGLTDIDDDKPSITVDKGTLTYNGTNIVPMMDMTTFFVAGNYPYSVDAESGVAIYFYDENSVFWSTGFGTGDQTGSTFEITALSPHASGVTVVMKFDCKLYSQDGTQQIDLKEGIMVLGYENK
ncbi:MAG TPA: hypothetical protein VEC12_00640 [Bacteroidia bacterium]|nr:hypothetical protein [Bacteroidia bacterium]